MDWGAIAGIGGLVLAALSLWHTSTKDGRAEKREKEAISVAGMATLVQETRAAQLAEREECDREKASLKADHAEEIEDLLRKHKEEMEGMERVYIKMVGKAADG